MAPTGCAFGSAICACATVRNRRARQVLPAYGLQAFPRTEYLNRKRRFLRTTHGGHFNMAETRTFLLCLTATCSSVLGQFEKTDQYPQPQRNRGH